MKKLDGSDIPGSPPPARGGGAKRSFRGGGLVGPRMPQAGGLLGHVRKNAANRH